MSRSESPIVVPQIKVCLQKAEVLVLRAHLEDWKSVKGKERSRVLLAIYKEASLQAPTKEKALLKAWRKIYKRWLQNQSCRRGAAKPLIKYGHHWTASQVLIHTHKALIRQEMGEMAGSKGMITKWPKAAKTVINCLSAEEREEAEAKVEKWNNEAAPPDIQAEVAKSKGANMIEHFVTEMFKKARMRVCILSTWKDSQGKLMLGGDCNHNFNEQFGDGESFIKTRDWDGIIMPEWVNMRGRNLLKEPSKMDKADATTVLDFWFDRQKNDMQPAFSFKAWKDSDGEMQEADLWPPSAHRANATKQSTGKGKGKANPKANHCHVAEDSNLEDELDSDLGEDGVSPSSEDEEAPSTGGEPESLPPPKVALPTKRKRAAGSRRDTRQGVAEVLFPPDSLSSHREYH
ncbi:hypothetical protein EV424DRAFT_1347038 [Suillus variegatus]|nr:hypothetical protein EV424DRAFT_1347038 [Suillus variegatus]